MEISISDNFFNEENYRKVINYCLSANYVYGEVDTHETPPTGMVSEIVPDTEIYNLFAEKIENKFQQLLKDKIYRMYINCFAPNENPYFHPDGESGTTFLYYPTIKWDIQEGGETQFWVNDNIYGVLPIANRAVVFDARIIHRATSFRTKHRFTVAIKYT